MPAGRPTDCTPELIQAAWHYVKGGWEAAGDAVPTVAGLACEIGVHRGTIYRWADEGNQEISDIVLECAQQQERKLVSGGLLGDFQAKIAGMMLSKHGYAEKVETENFTVNISPDDAKL